MLCLQSSVAVVFENEYEKWKVAAVAEDDLISWFVSLTLLCLILAQS